MKIKDLPQEIKELALLRQKEAGNEPNEELDLDEYTWNGNFNWEDTYEKWYFWNKINRGNFQLFYDLYKQPTPLTEHLQSLGYTVVELARHLNSKYPLLFCTKGDKSVFVAKYEAELYTDFSLYLPKLVSENVSVCILDSEMNVKFGEELK